MKILGIETSCDETAAAVVENDTIQSNIVESQFHFHEPFGGVVPEIASRSHIEVLPQIVAKALAGAKTSLQEIDGIAATYTPGLLPALLTGLQYAKSLSFALKKPFSGVNHLEGHLHAIFLEKQNVEYPFLGCVVSGGHTHLYLVKDFGKYETLGATRDDACGEAFDKVAKLLGLGFPGGPKLDICAQKGNPKAFRFTTPKLGKGSLEFSFSGLKTACLLKVKKEGELSENFVQDLAASFQETATQFLMNRLLEAAKKYKLNRWVVCGGVAANSSLRQKLKSLTETENYQIFIPSISLCTDNAAMIAYVGGRQLKKQISSPLSLNAKAYTQLS